MANPLTVGYDEELSAEERTALENRDTLFSDAFQASHYWAVAIDGKGRRYIRALGYSDRQQCLGQFILKDIQQISDEQKFKDRIIGGEFACSELP